MALIKLISLRYIAPKSQSEKAAKRAAVKRAEKFGFTNISADQTRPFSQGLSVYLTAEHPNPKGAAAILHEDEPYWISTEAKALGERLAKSNLAAAEATNALLAAVRGGK